MKSIICLPEDCKKSDLEAFITLVVHGRAVSEKSVRHGAPRALRLAFVRDASGTLVAVGALKRPSKTYRKRVFRKAGAKADAMRFNLELGYVAVDKTFRGSGLSHSILAALLPFSAGANIFATTRADKPAMHRTLTKAGFIREGQPYLSDEGPYNLDLYVWLA